MKKIYTILLLVLSLHSFGATYYISTTGTDGAGVNGSIGTPWRTLQYACTRVTTAGNTIYVNAGTYNETIQSLLAVGVSIRGAGATSVINSNISTTSTPTIRAGSTSEGTAGNQSISYIKMTGGSVAWAAIWVVNRSNVRIHHCTFENFYTEGVTYYGTTVTGAPSVYATDNQIDSCTFTNSGRFVSPASGGHGNIEIGGQDSMVIFGNTITALGRTSSSTNGNGVGIKIQTAGGYCKNVKIHNNTITTDSTYISGYWPFTIETWNLQGGVEIYDNELWGTIDIAGGGTHQGSYAYGISIHDNTIGYKTLQVNDQPGIHLETEGAFRGARVYNNLIKNCNQGITSSVLSNTTYDDIQIYYNIFDNLGRNAATWTNTWGIVIYGSGKTNVVWDSLMIMNNVFSAATVTGAAQSGGLCIGKDVTSMTVTNLYFRNNIVQGFEIAPVYTQSTATVNYAWVQNNIFYLNESNVADFNGPTTNLTTTNNLTSNPLFEPSVYSLQATSPAINAGIALSLAHITSDYAGVSNAGTPNIGAYEYQIDIPAVNPRVVTSPVVSIRTTAATSGGDVTDDGGGTISARGVCWNTSPSPTTANSKTTNSTGTGSYTSAVTSLAPDTKYYLRAYATNEAGTSYGAEIEFTTPNYVFIIM